MPQSAQPSGDGGYPTPDELRYEERWLQTDAVDFGSADGTFIRAFIEASELRYYVGSYDASYPGYAAALAPALAAGRTPDVEDLLFSAPAYGVIYRRVISVDVAEDNTVRVVGCKSTPGIPPTPPPSQRPGGHGLVEAFALSYRRSGDSPPAEQHGARKVPYDSVFGDWYAVEYDPLYGDTDPTSREPCYTDALTPSDTVELGWPAGPQPRA